MVYDPYTTTITQNRVIWRHDRAELLFVRVSLSDGFSEHGTWFRFVEKSGSGSDFHLLLSNLLQFSFRNSFLHVSLLKTVMIPPYNWNSLGKKVICGKKYEYIASLNISGYL